MISKVLGLLQNARQKGKKLFAVLIDPDGLNDGQLAGLASASSDSFDLLFVGGSLLMGQSTESCVARVKETCAKPVVLFPGSILQVAPNADALFFLSLISGRNPEMLIGQHVVAAPSLRKSGLEILPTGYMLIDGGVPTAVSYMSNTEPIPRDKIDIAACTAMAGEMLGLKVLYMDAGSGARYPIDAAMIAHVRKHTDLPIIVGGGIRSADDARKACAAGADVVVVGNAIETNGSLIGEIGRSVQTA